MLVTGATRVTYARIPVGAEVGHQAAIVLFTVESYDLGNDYLQFLAVFLRTTKQGGLPKRASHHAWRLYGLTVVGSGGDVIYDSATVAGATIELTGKSWTPRDPYSHPTASAHAIYRIAPYSVMKVSNPKLLYGTSIRGSDDGKP